jgi:GMP synthase (glutamine-hydrolysing)
VASSGFAILDFGSQYTQLIARRLRELGVFSEILPYNISIEKLRAKNASGIILSGGPSSVYDKGAPKRSIKELRELAPVLGICYGMQLMAQEYGGKVSPGVTKEYGHNVIRWKKNWMNGNSGKEQKVWMSHGDFVSKIPKGFELIAESDNGLISGMEADGMIGLQFHPEVNHTERGEEILKKFIFDKCGAKKNWSTEVVKDRLIAEAKAKVGDKDHVLCALSGGVDSTVVGILLTEALGADRVHCVFVNNGLLRKNDFEEVQAIYRELGLNLHAVDAEKIFLKRLNGVEDPEKKRKIIGKTFIDVFDGFVKKNKGLSKKVKFLAQGTLYPDVIESVSPRGTSVTIKTHHNVGGLPKKMKMKLVEPFRELFKDEVRKIGKLMKIPDEILGRHPFPGPGLAVRLIGPINKVDLDILREVDEIFIDELHSSGLYNKIWQAFAVLLPVKSVGVQGDSRSYSRVAALRAVTSTDGMTADWYEFDSKFLKKVSSRITNEVHEVNRVVYDISSKPPATIEWE